MFPVSLISVNPLSLPSLNFANRDFIVRRIFHASKPRERRGFGVLYSLAVR